MIFFKVLFQFIYVSYLDINNLKFVHYIYYKISFISDINQSYKKSKQMSLSIEKLIFDAKKLSGNLKEKELLAG